MRIRLGPAPLEPPKGTPPEAVEHFRKLDPMAQRYAVAAREALGEEPPGTLNALMAAAGPNIPLLGAGDGDVD